MWFVEEYKEKIDMYVELSSVIKYGINKFDEKNIIIIGDVGMVKLDLFLCWCFGCKLNIRILWC